MSQCAGKAVGLCVGVADTETSQSPSCAVPFFTWTFATHAPTHCSDSDMFQACEATKSLPRLPLLSLWRGAILVLKFSCEKRKQCSWSAEVCYSLGRGTASGRQSPHHCRWLRLLLVPNVLINIYFHSYVAPVHRKKNTVFGM